MQIEESLYLISSLRKKIHSKKSNQHKLFSGIDELDKTVKGFNSDKIYTIVARTGNGIYSFANTIANNIDVLYQTNYSVILPKTPKKESEKDGYWHFLNENNMFLSGKEVFSYDNSPFLVHFPILLIGDINFLSDEEIKTIIKKSRKWRNFKVLVIFLYILKDNRNERIKLIELPNEVQNNSDVIISLFRPEYYHKDHWEDGFPTANQLEFSIIKNAKKNFPKGRLYIEKEKRKVFSNYSTFLKIWRNQTRDILENENHNELFIKLFEKLNLFYMGDAYISNSPFVQDKNYSLIISHEKGTFKDFASGKEGSIKVLLKEINITSNEFNG